MSLSDPIGDMLARIKNSQMRSQKKVEMPSSKFKTKIAEVLKEEGFIIDFKVEENEKKQNLIIMLKYNFGNPVINTIERVSKPGRRIFSSAESLPKINNGLGIAIISTPKGVMTDVNARNKKLVEKLSVRSLMSKIENKYINTRKSKSSLTGNNMNVEGPFTKKPYL